MNGIQCENITFCPMKDKKPILKKITVSFQQGGFYAVLGPNGSGKTTFLRHIMRFLQVQQGRILFEQQDIGEYKQKEFAKKTAFVPQNANLESDFSLYDIVMMGRNPHRKRFSGYTKEDMLKVEEAMHMASVEHLKKSHMSSLSGGEAQRAAFARAIAQDTPWILLDEPTASLDIKHQIHLMEILKNLNEEKGVSIIMVLHDINLAAAYCKEFIMMKDGQIRFTGEKDMVLNTKNLEEIYEIPFIHITYKESGENFFMPIKGK